MAADTLERELTPAAERVTRPIAAALPWLTIERALYSAMVILAVALRLVNLGASPLDYHEAGQALAAYRLATGDGLPETPYSPLLLTFNFILYALLGAGNTLTRLLPVLAGATLVLTPYWLRRWLGRPGALATAALLIADPAYLFFSRQLDEAIVTAAATLALLTIGLRYMQTPIARRLLWLAVWLALALVSGPGAWLFVAVATASTLLIVYSGRDTVTCEELLAAGRAVRDDRQAAMTALAVGIGVFVTLATAVFFNPDGFQAVLDNAAAWFLVTPDSQSWTHYPMVALVYETLIVVLALVGVVWFLRQRNLLVAFLLAWFVVLLVVMGVTPARPASGIVTLMLPLMLIAGMTLGRFLDGVREHGAWSREGLYLLVALPFLVGPALQIAAFVMLPTTQPDQETRLLLIVALFGVFIAFISWAFGAWLGRGVAARSVALLGLVILGLLWLRTSALVNYPTKPIPLEFLGGPRTATDVPATAANVLGVALDRFGAPVSQSIAVDRRLTPIFEWYLRWSPQVEVRNNVAGSTAPQLLAYVATDGQSPTPPAGYVGQVGRYRHAWDPSGLAWRAWLRWFVFRDAPSKPPTLERYVWFSRPTMDAAPGR